MFEVKVKKLAEHIEIKWQLSTIRILISDIVEVFSDETYGGEEKPAIRIGYPYGTTDRVTIKTKNKTYLLYTSQPSLKEKIISYLS
ncbi:hypothetical protein JCM9140_4417 [Halalkalibacter wakoensis JCM 9140]|uniref:Sublancin immunity protein SunI-like PH domain-containing protein n=1 Tax=Halalkalibacter wakoensis JCM 9140 TaxID=1236970 RepID=W4Q894_9BACI|nr:hypothetical protein [Halalkalibacter wakoensis]GAE28207.1 hypothetical protein JCM9140_4417 [Halalkalibacter wakoensis JCM 9140]